MKIKYWIPVFIWMVFIFLMSTNTFSAQHTSHFIIPLLKFLKISDAKSHFIHGLIRKSGHVTEYFILSCLTIRTLCEGASEALNIKIIGISFLIVLFFAASDEFHQSFVPTRTASIFDVLIDLMGGVAAILVVMIWKKFLIANMNSKKSHPCPRT